MYTRGFREAALRLYEHSGSMRHTARALKISVASVCRWTKRISPVRRQSVRGTATLNPALRAIVREVLLRQPATSCVQLTAHIQEVLGIRLSRQLVHCIVRSEGFTHKRTRKRGVSPRTIEATPAFLTAFAEAMHAGTLISVDESGFDHRCVPIYGYAPKGMPAIVKWLPHKDRRRLSLLMALHQSGEASYVLHAQRVNGDVFASFIDSLPFVCGSVLLLDNASIHKTATVKAAMHRRGYTALFLPPYSPELNPIELVFGVIKNDFYRRRYTPAFEQSLECTVRDCVQQKTTQTTVAGAFRHVSSHVSHLSEGSFKTEQTGA